jgi:uncharacterized BrkB/YihY/UPF0761 family membrane protein
LQRYRIHVRSGFLALWALESIAPIAVLVAAIGSSTGRKRLLVDGVEAGLASSILGKTSGEAAQWLTNVLSTASFSQLGVLGVASSLLVVYQLYVAVLYDANDILGPDQEAEESTRSWWMHFWLFIPFSAWVVLLMIGGMIATGWMVQNEMWLYLPVVYLGSAGLLVVGPKMLCREPPPLSNLVGGALVGALWLELLKVLFFVYSTSGLGSSTLSTTYRQLAFLPLVFLWMHLLWFSVLLSMTVARVSADADGPSFAR